MRETVANITLPTIRPTFESVHDQFETWRKRRRCRGRIPEALWQAALGLCNESPVGEVSRALRLNYAGLKNRVSKAKSMELTIRQDPALGDFVKLDLGSPMVPSGCLVEMEAPNGAKMKMSLRGILSDFDPVELSRAFWSQGR
jgi:hypothetical protein